MTPDQIVRRARCLAYLGERTGTYEWRCLRYAAAYDRLQTLGLAHGDLIVDVGAGMCDFDRYLRTVQAWDGRYLPVDGAIDGTDLNVWRPHFDADFFVALELIEHLRDPARLLFQLERHAAKGVIVTTPNPEVVDVLAIDRTHVTPVGADELAERGYSVEALRLFGKDADTLIAWKDVRVWREPRYPKFPLDPHMSPSQQIVAGMHR